MLAAILVPENANWKALVDRYSDLALDIHQYPCAPRLLSLYDIIDLRRQCRTTAVRVTIRDEIRRVALLNVIVCLVCEDTTEACRKWAFRASSRYNITHCVLVCVSITQTLPPFH